MKHFILSIDTLVNTFTIIESVSHVTFELELNEEDYEIILNDIEKNDIIFGYYPSPVDSISSIYEVISITNNKIELNKKLETSILIGVKELISNSNYLSLQTSGKILSLSNLQVSAIYERIRESEIIPDNFEYESNEEVFDEMKVLKSAQKLKNKIDEFSLDNIGHPFNWIIYGAPGTGKSFGLNTTVKNNFKDNFFERVTFYNRYSYNNFVGAYKPFTYKGEITYGFVPGPFIRTLLKAYTNIIHDNEHPVCLLIEEINRADAASVFGDVFQLLDRSNGVSEYPIETSIELRELLCNELVEGYTNLKDEKLIKQCRDVFREIKIPPNMYLWGTMNSADQGVFPMDTAFKRRWEFKYLDINLNEELILDVNFIAPNKDEYNWNNLRRKINDRLRYECKLDEDKLIGPFFISYGLISNVKKDMKKHSPEFNDTFKNKILMYLFEDAGRHFRDIIFKGCKSGIGFSEICQEYDSRGLDIFKFT